MTRVIKGILAAVVCVGLSIGSVGSVLAADTAEMPQTSVSEESIGSTAETDAQEPNADGELPDAALTDISQQVTPAVTGASFEPDVLYQSSEAEFSLTVGYTALTPDKAYYVTATLVNPDTGMPWLLDGEPVQETAGLVPEGSDGTLEIPFLLDVTQMEGSFTLTPHIEVLQEGGLTVCTSRQGMSSISIVSPVLTQTFLATSGNGKIPNDKSSALVQTITYHGLEPGEVYKVDGELCAGRIQTPIELEDGTHYTASETFTPTAEDGRVVLTYKVDGQQLPGITIVPRWELYKGSSLVSALTDGTLEPKIAVEDAPATPAPSQTQEPQETQTPVPASEEPSPEPSEESEPSEEPDSADADADEQAAQQAQTMMIVVGVVVIGAIGAGVYFIFLRRKR